MGDDLVPTQGHYNLIHNKDINITEMYHKHFLKPAVLHC